MDILGNLVGGQACAADGTTAARNPISRLVDSLMEGSAGGQQKGRTRRAFNPQQQVGPQGASMMHASPGAAAAAHAHAHAQGMPRGMPMGMPGGVEMGPPMAEAWMGPPGNGGQHHHPQVLTLAGLRRSTACYSYSRTYYARTYRT